MKLKTVTRNIAFALLAVAMTGVVISSCSTDEYDDCGLTMAKRKRIDEEHSVNDQYYAFPFRVDMSKQGKYSTIYATFKWNGGIYAPDVNCTLVIDTTSVPVKQYVNEKRRITTFTGMGMIGFPNEVPDKAKFSAHVLACTKIEFISPYTGEDSIYIENIMLDTVCDCSVEKRDWRWQNQN